MNAVICVPYRDDGGYRKRNWEALHNWWLSLGYPVITAGGPPDEPFDITKARNAAVYGATQHDPDWDVVLMTDSDVWLQRPSQVTTAMDVAFATGQYAAAHSELRYLNPEASEAVRRGHLVVGQATEDAIELTTKETWETCFAFTREAWETVGGFDPRFRGFGHQVEAFHHAVRTLFGAGRVDGPCYHLWHPYSADQANPDLLANRELVERYWAASGDRDAMLALLDEYEPAA